MTTTPHKTGLSIPTPVMERHFWKDVMKDSNGCWYWQQASLTHQIHLTKNVFGPWKNRVARRFAFASHYRRIPKHFVFVTCGDAACVNPAHLVESNAPHINFKRQLGEPEQSGHGVPIPSEEWLNDTGPHLAVKKPEAVPVPKFEVAAALLIILGAVSGVVATLTPLHWVSLVYFVTVPVGVLLAMVLNDL